MNKKFQKNQNILTGLHIIGDIYANNKESLKSLKTIKEAVSKIIKKYHMKELGSFYYQFPSGGFTAIISLVESHIAIHTWPEFGYLTLDVYLCNYLKDNSNICKNVFEEISKLFNPFKTKKRLVMR